MALEEKDQVEKDQEEKALDLVPQGAKDQDLVDQGEKDQDLVALVVQGLVLVAQLDQKDQEDLE